MKVLMGAYACVPWWGSEPGAGWYWAEAASEHHEVWVLTSTEHRHHVEACLDQFPTLRDRLHFVYVELPPWGRHLRDRRLDLVRYVVWQRAARRAADRLHAEIGFDVAHHVTWTVSWLPASVTKLSGVPFIWGPVSGASGVPRAMWRWLGWRGAGKELLREVAIPIMRAVFARDPLRRSHLVLAQSEDFAAWARRRRAAPVVVEPVVALRTDDFRTIAATPVTDDDRPLVAVFAARFQAWKGLLPSIAALAQPEAREWHLDVYGAGQGEREARRLVGRLGLTDRVQFRGEVPRVELDRAIARADAFVHPSFHDAPPFVVAEALSLGCPVVCLDVGAQPRWSRSTKA